MRVTIAPHGNALHGWRAMTSEYQRENVRLACDRLAPIAEQSGLIILPGNGPRIGCWPAT